MRVFEKNDINTNIGKPIYNTSCYILDNNKNPMPVGAIGELYIGGNGLSRGYLNNQELTDEKFIQNPFYKGPLKNKINDVKIYKTGDLAKYLPNGDIEYIGRNDFQVKIRGFRVELLEIRNKLAQYPGVIQAVVLAKENKLINQAGNKYLVGYYVSDTKLDEELIFNYLNRQLPDYMVPSALISLDKIPLTVNGKMDRNAFPDPVFTNTHSYVAPRNELEKQMINIFTQVLGIDETGFGINDDFFKSGGNSMLAINLVSKLNAHFQSSFKVPEIFRYRTVENLVKTMGHAKKTFETIVKLNTTEDKPKMFMIHSGSSTCWAYASLANKLNDTYSCYGVDNYNLYNTNKLLTLNALAEYYAKNILLEVKDKSQVISLLGWSLGGLIALEVASVFEKKGYNNLTVCLLDTIIYDNKLEQINGKVDFGLFKQNMGRFMYEKYTNEYAELIMQNFDLENKINQEVVSNKLETSNVVLFKALQGDPMLDSKMNDYVGNLKFNNIDLVVTSVGQIELIKIENANHGSMLEQEDILVKKIVSHSKE